MSDEMPVRLYVVGIPILGHTTWFTTEEAHNLYPTAPTEYIRADIYEAAMADQYLKGHEQGLIDGGRIAQQLAAACEDAVMWLEGEGINADKQRAALAAWKAVQK